MKEPERRFIGIDLGKRSMTIHAISVGEKHASWTCMTDVEGRIRLLKRLTAFDIIAMEACPLAFILKSIIEKQVGATVYVLNPHGLALIYRSTKKTDREDAAKLAWVIQRLPQEELPTVTVPTESEQELRSLVVEQVALVQSKTREVNRLHALFVQDGITTIRKKDLRSTEARNRCYTELSPSTLIRAHRLERLISVYEENLEEVEGRIRTLVADNKLTPYLMSIPGVGPNLVAAFLGYLGDGSRFSIDRVAAYAGLVPRIDCSGDKNRYGSITKTGCSVLRRALVQGAWGLTRSSYGGVLGRKYRSWVSTKGKGKAVVALARKLLQTMWILATREALYVDFDPDRYNQKLARYHVEHNGVAGAA